MHCPPFSLPLQLPNIVDELVEAGANTKAHNGSEPTPLHLAADHLSLAASPALLKLGADANSQDKDRRTPLHDAAHAVARRGTPSRELSSREGGGRSAEIGRRRNYSRSRRQSCRRRYAFSSKLVSGILFQDLRLEPVRRLLANAPADRAWRRRGYLALCRDHPDRTQLVRESSSAPVSLARQIRGVTPLARTEPSGGSNCRMYHVRREG